MAGIGELRQRVSIENPTRTADGDGGYTEAWAAASPSPVWAKVEPATARIVERMIGNTIDAPISLIVTIRTHSGVTTTSRVTHQGRRLAVRGIQRVDEINHWMVLACEEIL